MPLYEFDKLFTTSGEAIREFSDRYIAAQGVSLPSGWVELFGDVGPVNSPKITYPISQLSGKYQETTGESRFKRVKAEASFDVKVVERDMGYEAALLDLYQNLFVVRKWNETPSRFMVAEANLRAEQIATLLEAGTSTTIWDGSSFFATDHPANVDAPELGTWSNYQSSTKDPAVIADVEGEITAMRVQVKDENGKKLKADPDTMLVPTEKFQKVVNVHKQDLIANAAGTATIRNPLQGTLNIVHVPELTDVNDWYLVDSKLIKAQGLPLWAALRYVVPANLGLRFWDESSDHFKDTGNIKASSHVWHGFSLVFPHAIRKIAGA